MDLVWNEIGKLLAAVAAGALIGLERETADKPAGFRTNILICLGAALFTIVSIRMADGFSVGERTRIAAQIVTGVGFLGAGAILHHRGAVIGLTTAATIWAVASVGMAFGAGEYALGTLGTVLTTLVLFGLRYAEARIFRWRSEAVFEIELTDASEADALLHKLAGEARVTCRSWTLEKTDGAFVGKCTAVGPGPGLEHLQRALAREPIVRAIRRL